MKSSSEARFTDRKLTLLAATLARKNLLSRTESSSRQFFHTLKKEIDATLTAYAELVADVNASRYVSREVEWLMDNFYVVESAAEDVTRSLKSEDIQKLPSLLTKAGTTVPHVYDVVFELLRGTDNTVTTENVSVFFNRYQREYPLSIREANAIPLMLKLVLVLNIRDLITSSLVLVREYSEAEEILKKIDTTTKKSLAQISYVEVVSMLTTHYKTLSSGLGVYLIEQLSQSGSHMRPVIRWLKLHLLQQGVSIERLREIDNEQRDKRILAAANIVEGLRWVSQIRWDDFLEKINPVDAILTRDPAQQFAIMDSRSKSAYYQRIVQLADGSGVADVAIARLAVRLARAHADGEPRAPEAHVGYYLVDDGASQLEEMIHYRPPFSERVHRWILRYPTQCYFSLIAAITAIVGYPLFLWFTTQPIPEIIRLFVVLATLLLSIDIALSVLHAFLVGTLPVRRLFSLDTLATGLTPEQATCVVVPSMMRNVAALDVLFSRFESNFVGNQSTNIFFILLLDFPDAPQEIMPDDGKLLEEVRRRIQALNEKYPTKIPTFYALCRKRMWNQREGVFMGWERKRGKLREFNKLIRGATNTSYVNTEVLSLPRITYAITLDEDTELPREGAHRLIGCIDHVLNRPQLTTNRMVTRGYGIIQPRASMRMHVANQTFFSRLFSTASGIDSYAGPSADLYQDLFGAGIFYGKGIYDIDVVETTMDDAIPENTVLSHDLLEGLYTRVGFASHIQVFEGFPARFSEYSLRQRRWIRGDWQIISWLWNRSVHFSFIDRWKIFDNLRRSVQPIVAVGLLLLTAFYMPHAVVAVSVAIIATFFLGSSIGIIYSLVPRMRLGIIKSILAQLFRGLLSEVVRTVVRGTLLFYEALALLQEIVLTIFRMCISHRHLLQWRTAHEVAQKYKGTIIEYIRLMGVASVLVLAIGWFVVVVHPASDTFTFLFWIGMWCCAPFFMFLLGLVAVEKEFSARQKRFLRTMAYRSLRYFIDFATEKNNYLIPDHYQVDIPYSGFAPGTMTSITNIGMMLASFYSGHRLGFISQRELLERLRRSCDTLSTLERYKGHFYNWYHIHHRQAAMPKYISSVDSANFLFVLTALIQGLRAMPQTPVVHDGAQEGLEDMLNTIKEDALSVIRSGPPKDIIKFIRAVYDGTHRALLDVRKLSTATPSLYAHMLREMELRMNHLWEFIENARAQSDHPNVVYLYASIQSVRQHIITSRAEADTLLSFHILASAREARGTSAHGGGLGVFYQKIATLANTMPTLAALADGYYSKALQMLDVETCLSQAAISSQDQASIKTWFTNLRTRSAQAETAAQAVLEEVRSVRVLCEQWTNETDFTFLYNTERGLFHIGYNVTTDTIDNAYYDFLASESNAVSFWAVSRGTARLEQWFRLSRQLISHEGVDTALASWGGSLFEYLTSLLFLNVAPTSILNEAARRAIHSQRAYARQKHVPWGMGESAFAIRHPNGDYQYQIFGDPGLGLKRGLGERLVVAPYTTALSLSYTGVAGIRNLKKLITEGCWGIYGFFDAIDYTESAGVFFKKRGVPVKIYYAHHLGFTIAAITNVLTNDVLKELFHRDPHMHSVDVILDEQYPVAVPLPHAHDQLASERQWKLLHRPTKGVVEYVPIVSDHSYRYAVLSNGTYTLTINNSGGGWSSYRDTLLTRQSLDPLESRCGNFIYLRDVKSGAVWSTTYVPTFSKGARARTMFSDDKVEFHQLQNTIQSTVVISVATDEPVEMRTVTLTNVGTTPRTLDVTSYGEVVLAKSEEYLQHPSFQKMFVSSAFHSNVAAIVFSKRSSNDAKSTISLFHSVVSHYRDRTNAVASLAREDFLGRHGSLIAPPGSTPSFTPVEHPEHTLDPIFSLSKRVTLGAGQSVSLSFITGVAATNEAALRLATKYQKIRIPFRYAELFHRPARTIDALGSIGVTPYHLELFQRLLSGIISFEFCQYLPEQLFSGASYMRTLWKYGISGDRPLVVVRISNAGDIPFVRTVLLLYRYCQHKNVAIDLVILNEYPAGYVKTFEDDIGLLIRQLTTPDTNSEQGSVFHLKTVLMDTADVTLIRALSRLWLDSNKGSLEKQIKELTAPNIHPLPAKFKATKAATFKKEELARPRNLLFANSIGGFDEHRGEYVMYLSKNSRTPVPWVNVIANEYFGTVVTESGAATTWSDDSFDNRLTPWQNDSLVDRSGESLYLRDEETGTVWSPTPSPSKIGNPYIVRHGTGYSVFESLSFEIKTNLVVFVPRRDRIKVHILTLTNTGERERRVSLTTYVEPVLGTFREKTRVHVAVRRDSASGVMLAQNRFRPQFFERCMFVDSGPDSAYTSDRREFLGAHGRIDAPVALRRETLSNTLGHTDACIALSRTVTVAPGQSVELVVTIGEAADTAQAIAIAQQYRSLDVSKAALTDVQDFWNSELNALTFTTPDAAINLLANRWLLYQALSSRMFAKTGFYQPSGAFGFRDQLQDMAAFVWSNPARFREHIITAARHQFREGDALNWWHTHNNFGVRSTIVDHHAWLPWAVSLYVIATNDRTILDEHVAFLESPVAITAINKRWAGIPQQTSETATVYEHCIRAIEKSLVFGAHGLPLMGGGDWNDGLNRVGDGGRGESVWFAWFLIHILSHFILIAEQVGDSEKVQRYKTITNDLHTAIEKRAWDGAWYYRAFLDSGAPLGSSTNREFKIDSIAQSWSVLCGYGDRERSVKALASVKEKLMADGDSIRLIDPPLDKMTIDVGYLAAYPPGVRENGAQYNHAALWAIQAFALLGDADAVEEGLRRINPIIRSDSKEKVMTYRVEPYVIASDIYTAPSYPGRGGWTWYTGSAGVLYRTLVEYIYGMRKTGNTLSFRPSLPRSWNECSLVYRYGQAIYKITIHRDPHATEKISITLDGQKMSGDSVLLSDERGERNIDVLVSNVL